MSGGWAGRLADQMRGGPDRRVQAGRLADIVTRLEGVAGQLETMDQRVKRIEQRLQRIDKTTESDRGTLKELQATLRGVQAEIAGRGLIGAVGRVEQGVRALHRAHHLRPEDAEYPERLTVHRFQLWSQNEEDGTLLALLREAGTAERRFVEIGCGTNGGNTGFLADELGWRGLMIDGHEPNIAEVRRRFKPDRVTAVRAWVTREDVDELVRQHGFAGPVDVLSIDIDGNDYWVWEALEAAQPRIVVVEYNSLFGPNRAVVVPYDPGFNFRAVEGTDGMYYGASLAALAALGRRRGFRLVATDHRGVNAFFLREDIATEIPACSPVRAFRLLDKHGRQRARGRDLYEVVDERSLPLMDVG